MTTLQDQIIACYLGKNIGGTLGAPHEGRNHTMDLNYYAPVPSEPATNDDLDLQIVWLRHLQEFGFGITHEQLARAWVDHIDFHPDEYGVAIANIKKGFLPPVSGLHNNYFRHSLGAAIRSEIWAALFPGQPEVAAYYAWLDGSVDHTEDGLYIIIYLAVLESDLFVSQNLEQSMRRAYDILPESRLKQVIARTAELHRTGVPFEQARTTVTREFHSFNCSDAVMNMGFIQLGLLYGEGDFETSILLAVNCGQDTDSTGATVGSILGILLGTGGIPQRWRIPIGDAIRMSNFIRDLEAPPTVDAFADEIKALQQEARRAVLPRLEFPLALPVVADVMEPVLWRVNGKPMTLNGFILDVRYLEPNLYADIVFETEIVSPVDREVRLLTCSSGYNKFYFDDVYLGQWGAFGDAVIPAFHRTSGGLCWRLQLRANIRHRVKLAIYTVDREMPLVYCGLADTEREGRHLTDIRWGLEPIPR